MFQTVKVDFDRSTFFKASKLVKTKNEIRLCRYTCIERLTVVLINLIVGMQLIVFKTMLIELLV